MKKIQFYSILITLVFVSQILHQYAADATIIKEFNFNVAGVLPSAEIDTVYVTGNGGSPVIDEADAFSVLDGTLRQRTLSVNGIGNAFYQSSSYPGFDPTADLIIEARLRVLNISDERNTGFSVSDGLNDYRVLLEDSGLKYLTEGEVFSDLISFNVDVGGSFHTYRLESAENTNAFDFYVDGSWLFTGNAGSSSINKWEFGDISWGPDADVDWDYISFSQITAVPEPATILLLGIGLAGLAGGAVRRKWKKRAVEKKQSIL